MPETMQGMLLIDKPTGWTSFDVVNYVRRMVATAEDKKPKNVKVGHTGTLDPLATGLLVLLVGKEYTRKATELTKLDKSYEVTMKLGETSTTADAEGEIKTISETQPTEAEIVAALQYFTGEIMQTPPAFSAMKINGQRAYKLAREGKAVELEARPVTIYKNELVSYEYPFVKFMSEVGSGTYIRSLVEDLGKQLQTGAYMSDLRRTRVGKFSIEDAQAVKTVDITKLIE
jgi:tRNA pseudouridine55 synthase